MFFNYYRIELNAEKSVLQDLEVFWISTNYLLLNNNLNYYPKGTKNK